MPTNKPQQLSVLLEHEDGAMEVFFAVLQNEHEVAFQPVGSGPRAGSMRPTDRDRLTEAIRLLKWSEDHAEVFEGRVSH